MNTSEFNFFVPEHLDEMLYLLNKIWLHNFSITTPDGHVYGYLENINGFIPEISDKFEIWSGNDCIGARFSTLESACIFFAGVFFTHFEGSPQNEVYDYINEISALKIDNYFSLAQYNFKRKIS